MLRDFNSHDRWHAVVAESRIEGGERADQVGCVRSFTLKRRQPHPRAAAGALRPRAHARTYCILDATRAAAALRRHACTLKPVTDGDRTFWHWESTFATPPGRERELRDMVAQDVYEAGFENLRRHLRDGGDRRGRAAPRPMPARCRCRRGASSCARYGGPEVLAAERRRGAGARRRRGAHPPARDRRQLHRRLPAHAAGSRRCCALPGVPGMEAAGTVVDVGAGVSGLLPGDRVAYLGPAPGRLLQRAHACRPTGSCACPPAIEDDVAAALLLKGITADFLLRDLGRVRRRHAPARACRGRRRRPARLRLGAPRSARR